MKNETKENINKLREIIMREDIESILSDARFLEIFLNAYRKKGIPDHEIAKKKEVRAIFRNLGETIKRIEFELSKDENID